MALFPTDRQWSFAELYLDCIANSQKSTKNLKDKMVESQIFSVNYGKISLLINVGRINTTIACKLLRLNSLFTLQVNLSSDLVYPEMRTAVSLKTQMFRRQSNSHVPAANVPFSPLYANG